MWARVLALNVGSYRVLALNVGSYRVLALNVGSYRVHALNVGSCACIECGARVLALNVGSYRVLALNVGSYRVHALNVCSYRVHALNVGSYRVHALNVGSYRVHALNVGSYRVLALNVGSYRVHALNVGSYRVHALNARQQSYNLSHVLCCAFIAAPALRCLKVSACICGPDRIAPGFGVNEWVFACLSGFTVFERSVWFFRIPYLFGQARTAVFWKIFRTKYGKSVLVVALQNPNIDRPPFLC